MRCRGASRQYRSYARSARGALARERGRNTAPRGGGGKGGGAPSCLPQLHQGERRRERVWKGEACCGGRARGGDGAHRNGSGGAATAARLWAGREGQFPRLAARRRRGLAAAFRKRR